MQLIKICLIKMKHIQINIKHKIQELFKQLQIMKTIVNVSIHDVTSCQACWVATSQCSKCWGRLVSRGCYIRISCSRNYRSWPSAQDRKGSHPCWRGTRNFRPSSSTTDPHMTSVTHTWSNMVETHLLSFDCFL